MSKQPRKERKKLANLPQHQRQKQVAAHLAEDLLLKYDTRSTTVRVGDTVRILRGDFKGTTGEVLEVDTVSGRITVEGATLTKADQQEVPRFIDPSNVILTKLDLSDPQRAEKLGTSPEEPAPEPEPEPEVEEAPEAEEPEAEEADEPEATEADDDAEEAGEPEGPAASPAEGTEAEEAVEEETS